MAKVVDALPALENRGREKKYDFAKYYEPLVKNGKAVELLEGEDFTCSAQSIRQHIYQDAREHGYKAKVRSFEGEDGRAHVVFAVITLEQAEKEKAIREAKKAEAEKKAAAKDAKKDGGGTPEGE